MDDDEVWEEDEILDNATHCPSCEEMTAHDILHEKKSATVRISRFVAPNVNACTPSCFGRHLQPTFPSSSPMDRSPIAWFGG